MSIRIIVDSACDLTREQAKELNVEMIPLKTIFGEEEYLDGVTLTSREFFEKLIETDVFPSTSQIAPYEYEEKFREVKEAGDTAVCITISSQLSGCYQSANIALEEYEDCITVVDSENVCIGQQILVKLAARLRDEGKGLQKITDILNYAKQNIRLIALLDTLEYLKKGGRISPAVAVAGNLLSLKPVIAIEKGEVALLGTARGSKNGKNKLNELIQQTGGIDFDMPYCLAYSGLDDSLLKKYIVDSEDLYRGQVEELPISMIGSTIGTHAGPGAIAAAFFVKPLDLDLKGWS